MEAILEYIRKTYDPLSIILYGSYANGTNNSGSDFDALVITSGQEHCHDTSFVGEVPLDVFVYPVSCFQEGCDLEAFIQIVDGQLLADREGFGKNLMDKVRTYLQNRPRKSRQEIQANVDWCVKMLERAKRQDAEGFFRWHWVLIDSLEIFRDILGQPYRGPKKTLKWMADNQPRAFSCYEMALQDFRVESLENWIACLRSAYDKMDKKSGSV